MNQNEEKIREKLDEIMATPSDDLRERILADADAKKTPMKYRRRFNTKTILIAAALVVIMSTTVLAIGDDFAGIRRWFSFGKSTVAQIDWDVVWTRPGAVYGVYRVLGEDSSRLAQGESFIINYCTLEEARANFPFDIREPAYLPDTVIGLVEEESAGSYAQGDISGFSMYNAYLVYSIALPPNEGYYPTESTFSLMQTYYSSDVYFDMETVWYIEKYMIGDSEALLIRQRNTGNRYVEPGYRLIWVNDGIHFEL